MALKKSKTNGQGITFEYWIATVNSSGKTKKSQVILEGYISEESRNAGHNFIERVDCGKMNGQYPTGEDVYAFAKESKVDKEPIVDEDGKRVLGEDGKPTYTETETNWFIDAEDC